MDTPYKLKKYKIISANSDIHHIKNCAENNMLELEAVINFEGEDYVIKGKVNGQIDAFNNALKQNELKNYKFKNYHEHGLSNGSHVKGVAYVEIEDNVEVAYYVEKYDENEIRRIGKKLLKLLELEIKN
nr:alpha-isopropylmalate synthase regulatory domain-containing protein [Terrisporobacter hibernicus]